MAYYALINDQNIVVQVITGVDENETQIDLDGTEVGGSSEAWEQFYQTRPWFENLTCKRTSYNNKIRKQFAGIGFTYDGDSDVFVCPQPFPSWSLDENHDWQAPILYPDDGLIYVWNENDQDWEAYVEQSEA
jgi:hypothetical protein